jgi:peptidoglycan-associated lipoprotein
LSTIRLSRFTPAVCLVATLILSGCHKKTTPPPPPPPPASPAPASPTASITANPAVIQQGQATTLAWETSNATDASIAGIGTVPMRNSQVVSPTESTTYTITAKGPGGTVEQSARVTVNKPTQAALPPSMTEEELFAQNVKDVYFNYDKYEIESGDTSKVADDAAFLAKYPDMKVVIGGHCDERGSEEYNIALGENRAEALKKALVAQGIPATRIRVISYGKEKPFCTDEDEACWAKNRVDHLKLDQGQ